MRIYKVFCLDDNKRKHEATCFDGVEIHYLWTCAHCVGGTQNVFIEDADGKILSGEVLFRGTTQDLDIALIQTDNAIKEYVRIEENIPDRGAEIIIKSAIGDIKAQFIGEGDEAPFYSLLNPMGQKITLGMSGCPVLFGGKLIGILTGVIVEKNIGCFIPTFRVQEFLNLILDIDIQDKEYPIEIKCGIKSLPFDVIRQDEYWYVISKSNYFAYTHQQIGEICIDGKVIEKNLNLECAKSHSMEITIGSIKIPLTRKFPIIPLLGVKELTIEGITFGIVTKEIIKEMDGDFLASIIGDIAEYTEKEKQIVYISNINFSLYKNCSCNLTKFVGRIVKNIIIEGENEFVVDKLEDVKQIKKNKTLIYFKNGCWKI
jgi:hypothetical protein